MTFTTALRPAAPKTGMVGDARVTESVKIVPTEPDNASAGNAALDEAYTACVLPMRELGAHDIEGAFNASCDKHITSAVKSGQEATLWFSASYSNTPNPSGTPLLNVAPMSWGPALVNRQKDVGSVAATAP